MTKLSKTIKATALFTAIAGAYLVGEFVQPAKMLELKYKTEFLPCADNFFVEKAKLDYVVNDDRKVELYLVNEISDERFPINTNSFGNPKMSDSYLLEQKPVAKDFFQGNLELSYVPKGDSIQIYLMNPETKQCFEIRENKQHEPVVNSIEKNVEDYFDKKKSSLGQKIGHWKDDVSKWYERNFSADDTKSLN